MEQPQGDDIMRYYQALERASQEMLEAARAGDWDRVRRLESTCARVIANVRQLKQAQALSRQQEPQRLRILRRIVANDAEIRRIAQPLQAYIGDPVPAMTEPARLWLH